MAHLESVMVDYDVKPALTIGWQGGQQRRWPHFLDDVPADDSDDMIG